ncbi:DNA polymerase III subunit beta [Orenia metallireducens]|uniref:Beta sliding clamp n=1 Tax=Orenia metallireducens TaxID=1413210 RepID=A0A1C0ACT1_9FIRM|nr:DNA polymerase III subunit beta [Orenia metallireducens]OCL28436.1 DNA polymerase III subunit beta [Orenia metallireducens]
MRIELNKKDFYEGIQTVNRAVSSKATLPILSGILLKTEEDRIKLVATDLEIGIKFYVDANIIKEGSIVLPAKYFTSIVRELPDDKIILTAEPSNNTAQIKCGQAQFNIHGSSSDEFPLLPKMNSGINFTISQGIFKEMIDQVKFAISEDISKPFLTGGLLKFEEEHLVLVTTDTYRLSYRRIKFNEIDITGKRVIIPNKTLNEISKLLNNNENLVKVLITDNQILFEFSGVTIVSRLIDGQFPSYKQVIPNKNNTKAIINRIELLNATKRASLLAKKDSNIIKINLEENQLVITSNVPEIGQAYERIPISLTGQETEIAFNATYMMDCLKVISSEEVILELSGSLSPGVIKDNSEDEYIYIIMPVRSN